MIQPLSPLRKTVYGLSSGALSFAFLLTGVATALLGATLPVMLKEWHLTDSIGGVLLLLSWGGSTCGALLFRGSLRRSAASGLGLTALSMLGIAAIDRRAALPLFMSYGIGLGVAMTTITLLWSQAVSEAARRTVMMRLNLLWSVGACMSPTLATRALTHTRVGGLFCVMGLVFCASAIAVLFSGNETQRKAAADNSSALRVAPLALYAMAFLAVGVESAIGGWLTTYAGRTAHTELMMISATSGFWFGLLASRALHSVPNLRWLQNGRALIVHAAITALASATLLAAPHTAFFLPAALLAGFGLGPLYPSVLAMVVGVYKPRAIFLVAGVGAAALPWLTGSVSHAAGSLGSGLLVPCAGAAALLLLMLSTALQRKAAIAKLRETQPSALPCSSQDSS